MRFMANLSFSVEILKSEYNFTNINTNNRIKYEYEQKLRRKNK